MEAIIGITVDDTFSNKKLVEAISTGHKIQLCIRNLKSFNKAFNLIKLAFFGKENQLYSIIGPIESSYNSLFEDTVAVVSKLEDEFHIDIQAIATYRGSHVDELCDFYQDDIPVSVITLNEDPFNLCLYIENLRNINGYNNLYAGIDMTNLNRIWKDRGILSAFKSYIKEVHVFVGSTDFIKEHENNWKEFCENKIILYLHV